MKCPICKGTGGVPTCPTCGKKYCEKTEKERQVRLSAKAKMMRNRMKDKGVAPLPEYIVDQSIRDLGRGRFPIIPPAPFVVNATIYFLHNSEQRRADENAMPI